MAERAIDEPRGGGAPAPASAGSSGAARLPPLDGRRWAGAERPDLEVTALAPTARLLLQGPAEAGAEAAAALGLAAPEGLGRMTDTGAVAILQIGPGEWLIRGAAADAEAIRAAIEAGAGPAARALVAIGHRQAALAVEGAAAADLLACGCPLDLDTDRFTPGSCTRTLLGKAEILLWRPAPDRFVLEVARSVAQHVWSYLEEASHGLR